MFWRKKTKAAKPVAVVPAKPVAVGEWKEDQPAVHRRFPGPAGAEATLRVAVEREAYADLVVHAKERLDVEVCGVLAGEVCEDDQGVFIHVKAAVRGAAAREGGAHVTFTQETWNTIHATLERQHRGLRIVGWYHTHPGFGVQFSEMDTFIQKNFFPMRTQVALVTDPLSDEVAICVNEAAGIRYLPRFWVDGREMKCRVPESSAAAQPARIGDAGDREVAWRVLEDRVGQLVGALDQQRKDFYRMLMTLFILGCLTLVGVIGYTMYRQFRYTNEPPQVLQVVPIPVQIGDKTMLIEVGVAGWKVPPELNATLLQLELMRQEEAAAKAAAEKNNREKKAVATNAPSPTAK